MTFRDMNLAVFQNRPIPHVLFQPRIEPWHHWHNIFGKTPPRWQNLSVPELFDQLDADQRRAVVRSLAAGWHEGWEPNREDVADLIDYTRGALTFEDYQARSADKAARIAGAAAAL